MLASVAIPATAARARAASTEPGPFAAGSVSSNQFGLPNQTDVFDVAADGAVEVRWVVGAGAWNGPVAISAPVAPPGSHLAVSNQFGIPNQTDVFVVDGHGTTQLLWVQGAGKWNGPVPISPADLAPPGARLAVSNQFGIPNQTDVFVVGNNGATQVSWVAGAGAWNGPVGITPGGTAPAGAGLAASKQFGLGNQTDVFVVANNGATRVSWVDGTGAWNGPIAMTGTGLAPAGATLAASNQFGLGSQTDVFVVGNNGATQVSWVAGAGAWNGPVGITPGGTAPAGAGLAASNQFGIPDQTDVFVVDNSGATQVSWVDGGGAWNGPRGITPGGRAPAGAGLAASNQFGIPDQTDVFVVDNSGATQVSWVDGAGGWNGPLSISGPPPQPPPQPPPFSVNSADTYKVAQEDGPGSINQTDTRWDVYGADLGHMFVTSNGQIALTFGDTFGGPAAYPFFNVSHTDPRSNTMALINPSASLPTAGLVFSSMITDPSSPGRAKQLLAPQSGDVTVIPTYGIAVGTEMFLHYMSVQQWGAPGHWTLNNSGMAYSTDGGQTWTKDPNTRWPGNSNFGQVAMVKQPDGYVYLFGIPGGRYGALQLARVATDNMLNISAYQYWNGASWVTGDPSAAVDIVSAPVGELSVQWNSYYQKWLMTYLVDPTGQVVLRMSDSLTGPWSEAQVIVDSSQYPELYAPYITPLWDNGPDIYFNMSVYDHYQVYLMHTSLSPTTPATPFRPAATPSVGTTVPRPTYPYAHGRGSVRTP